MTSAITKHPHAVNLLNRILDQPELPAIIKSLDAGVLMRLIRHVGLEDSGPIVSHVTAKQLESVFDEDLWQSKTTGRAEAFNASRFGLWLGIMMENGPAFTARRVLEMDEDLLTLGICRLVRVVSIHAVNIYWRDDWQSDHGGYPESVFGESLNQVISDYRVISKDDSSWDAILGLLLYLNETESDTLIRLLRRCSRISEAYDDDHDSLLKKLSDDEMLEEDVAAEREKRKEAQGFVTPSSAAVFLDQSRSASLKRIVSEKSIHHGARFYIKSAEAKTATAEKPKAPCNEAARPAHKEMIAFIDTLQKDAVLPTPSQQKLSYNDPDFDDIHLPLITAMRIIKESDPVFYARRIMELSYLSNTLISGCGFRGREFRPQEAAEAALSVCNLGVEYLMGIDPHPEKNRPVSEVISAYLKTNNLVHLFRIGWKTLFNSVILTTANSLLAFLNRLKDETPAPDQRQEAARMTRVLRADISSGRPWEFHEEMDYLQVFLDGETTTTLSGFIQECPTFSEEICIKGGLRLSPFIGSQAHIRTLRNYLEDVLMG